MHALGKMGNTDSALQGMSDANNVMEGIPILGGAFRMQNAATDAGVGVLGGIGKLGSSPNMLLIVGGGVLLLVLLK